MNKSDTYIYKAGKSDEERLMLLNQAYNPFSQLKLQELISNKKIIVDLGCGQGNLSCWLAQQALGDATIIAVDINSEQLAMAKRKAAALNIQNIIFFQSSVQGFTQNNLIELCNNKADLIFCRWLLIHLTQKDIKKSLLNMSNMLKPKGILVNEEVDLSISSHPLEPACYIRYKEIFNELAKHLKIDFNLGSKLKTLLNELGLTLLKSNISDPIFTPKQLNFFIIDLKSSVELLEKYNISQANEIENLCQEFQHLSQDLYSTISMKNFLNVSVKN